MCDTLVASGAATAEGTTLFAKNSDRPAGECQPFVQLPALTHAPGTRLRCTHVEIPEDPETHAVMGHSPWWVWGFEQGVNEHGVAIGNEMVFSREPLEAEPGLIGMDLVRLGLERGRSAREALEAMARLLEAHGQGGAANGPAKFGYHNGFLLADPGEAWVMQTSNRRWAARRVELDAISNHLSIGSDWEIGSADVERFARAKGWWAEGPRLDFAAAYRNPSVAGRLSEGRLRRSRALLRRASGGLDALALRRILRDHGEDDEGIVPGVGPEEERFFTLCSHNPVQGPTNASLVAPLPSVRRAPWPVWIAFSTPCTSLFLPVYLGAPIPPELARGGEKPDPESAWWTFEALREAAERELAKSGPRLRKAWMELEAWAEAERLGAEAEARAALEARDPGRASACLEALMARTWEAAQQRARDLHAEMVRR